jgi:hypothetical protein
MSALEEDLLRRINAFMRARNKLEREAAITLADLYERARVETLQQLIEQYGQMTQMELQHVERVLQGIDQVLQPFTRESADLRLGFITQGWEVGQRLTVGALTADRTLAPALIGLEGNFGLINHGMVSGLFGNLPQLAGKVTSDVLERIRNQLVISAVRGESIPQMAKRIAGTGLTQEGLKRPFKTLNARATLIARTETIKAADAGYDDMVTQAQRIITEQIFDLWLTAQDERVEEECLGIAAGGASGAVPGYSGVYRRGEGPLPVISTHPGCRCRRVPILLRWITGGLVSLPRVKAA